VLRTTPGGDQIIVLHISPGQLFGIAPALQRDTYPATSIAAAESIALVCVCVCLLSAWEKEGIVASTRKRITLTGPHALVLLSGVHG